MKGYRISKQIALIKDAGTQQLRLNLVSWNGQPEKYDLRIWSTAFPNGWIPGKGILMNEDEARVLCNALLTDLGNSATGQNSSVEGNAQEAENQVFDA